MTKSHGSVTWFDNSCSAENVASDGRTGTTDNAFEVLCAQKSTSYALIDLCVCYFGNDHIKSLGIILNHQHKFLSEQVRMHAVVKGHGAKQPDRD